MCLISVMKYLRNTWNCHRFITSEISVYDNEFFFCLHRTILLVFISYMWKNKPLEMLFIVVDFYFFFLLYFRATLISDHIDMIFSVVFCRTTVISIKAPRYLFFSVVFCKATVILKLPYIWFFLLYFVEPQWYRNIQISGSKMMITWHTEFVKMVSPEQ